LVYERKLGQKIEEDNQKLKTAQDLLMDDGDQEDEEHKESNDMEDGRRSFQDGDDETMTVHTVQTSGPA
jgi:hypothetical protein